MKSKKKSGTEKKSKQKSKHLIVNQNIKKMEENLFKK